ncbi:hypothetical protein ABW19_dt0208427 [Dactylella cylindrospora]|nr:hypothetical protein ABW19_dt0208427 [Dactylella cylindrospora]
MRYLHSESRSSLKLYYTGGIDERHLLLNDIPVFNWHSITTTVDYKADNTRLLGQLLSRSPNLKELSVEFIPEVFRWQDPEDDPFYIFTQPPHYPQLQRLRLRGYQSYCLAEQRLLGHQTNDQSAPWHHIIPNMTRHLTHLDIHNPFLFTEANIDLSHLKSIKLDVIVDETDLWLNDMIYCGETILLFIRNCLRGANLEEIYYHNKAADTAYAGWKDAILPFAGTLKRLDIRHGVISSSLVRTGGLEALAERCVELKELSIDAERVEGGWPKNLFDPICSFPKLNSLTLYIPVRAFGISSRLYPEVGYKAVNEISEYFVNKHNRYFNNLRIFRGRPEKNTNYTEGGDVGGYGGHQRFRDMEHEELEIFDVVYLLNGYSGRGDGSEKRTAVVKARVIERYRRLLNKTDPRDMSYRTILGALRLCESRARGRLPSPFGTQ